MNARQTLIWKSGQSDAPFPPLVDLQDGEGHEQQMVDFYRAYGPIFRLSRAEKGPQIVLAGPEVNVFIARHEDEFFTTQEFWQFFDAMISQQQGGGLSEARDGEANRQRRKAGSREWSRTRILDQIPQMMEITKEYSRSWSSNARVAVHAQMRRIVAEQLGRLLLGTSPGDYLDDFITYLNTAIVKTLMSGGMKAVESVDEEAYQHAVNRVNEFSRLAYEAHLLHPEPSGKPDMIDDAIRGAQQYPEEVRNMLLSHIALGPMLAGLDTVANSLSFLLSALLANPEVAARVQAEVDIALSDGSLTREKLKQMPDLHGAMMETLRRYPVATGHTCRVASPLSIAGYRLEVGSDVFVAMTVPHFLEEIYPDPLRFDIDRFRAPHHQHRTPGAYAPFGLGNHTCLGAGIAEVQLMVTMATLLHSWSFQLDPPDYQLVIEEKPTPVPGSFFVIASPRTC